MNDLVKAKIIELVPEIVELKFGTLVRLQREPNVILHAQVVSNEHTNDRISLLLEISTAVNLYPKSAIVEVLGRPITLADVLRAIDGKILGVALDKGRLFVNTEDAHAYWNLTTDYDGQTQEVKDFIGKLLGV